MAWSAYTRSDNFLRSSREMHDPTSYWQCARAYDTRASGRDWKTIGHKQDLLYDEEEDCYLHRHHRTVTVAIYRDKYKVWTGGWDTPSTWAKVAEFCPINTFKPVNDNVQHTRLVGWGGRHPDTWVYLKFAPFYEGIEVDGEGVPLKPRPVTYERISKTALNALNANVRKVRDKLRTRMLVGEWDAAPTDMLMPSNMYVKAFEKLAAMDGWIDHDLVMPLFWHLHADVEPRSCRERFEHVVRYVRQAPSLRETYEKECF